MGDYGRLNPTTFSALQERNSSISSLAKDFVIGSSTPDQARSKSVQPIRLNLDKPKLSPYKKSSLLIPIREGNKHQLTKIPNLNPDLDVKKSNYLDNPT